MNERELNRIEVPAEVDDSRLTVANAAAMLAMTGRQLYRLLKRYIEILCANSSRAKGRVERAKDASESARKGASPPRDLVH